MSHRSTKEARRRTILHSIVAGNGIEELQVSLVRAQLDAGLAVDALDLNGNTALVVTALKCRNTKSNSFVEHEPKLARFLLERGADPSATSSSTTDPPNTDILTLAIQFSCSKLFTELLRHPGLRLNHPVLSPAGFLDHPEIKYDSVLSFVLGSLSIASSQGSFTVESLQSMAISLIRDRRVFVNGFLSSYPSLFQAVSQSPPAIVQEMLQREDLCLVLWHDVDISNGNQITMNPLHLSLQLQRLSIAVLILQELAARSQLDLVVNSATSRGDTPLLILAKTCSDNPNQEQLEHVVSLLLSEKADLNTVDLSGRSAVSWAVYNGCLRLVDLLLDQEGIVINKVYDHPAISDSTQASPVPNILQQALRLTLKTDRLQSSRMIIVWSLLKHFVDDLNANGYTGRKQALQLALELALPKSILVEISFPSSVPFDALYSTTRGTIDSAALHLAVKLNRSDIIPHFTAYISADAVNEGGATPLCILTARCDVEPQLSAKSDSTFAALLVAGADPNQFCAPDVAFDKELSILQRIVLRRCIGMRNLLLPVSEPRLYSTPVDVNALSPDGLNALHLALGSTSQMDEDYGYSFVQYLIAPKLGLDVNYRVLETGLLPVELWCNNIRHGIVADSAYQANVLQMFLWHPDLNDEQRELALNHCGLALNTIGLSDDEFWEFKANPSAQPGTDAFARTHLNSVLRTIDSLAQLDDNILRLPMEVIGLPGEDAGGVVASFLDQLTAAAFCFGSYASVSSMSPCKDIFAYVQVSVDELVVGDGGIDKLFSPAPSSLLPLFVDKVHIRVLKRMKVIGTLIGVTLNTLFYSTSLTLGVPLDRVVLQRLIKPSSTIERSEALDSAVCVQARLMWRAKYSLQQAQEEFPDSWPVIAFPYSAGTMAGTGDEWNDYCVELVDQLLQRNMSPAFTSMLEGFELTVPSRQKTHHFSPALAHRMLVGTGHTTWQMLKPHLRFKPRTDREEEEKLFLSVLQKLSRENEKLLNYFVKEVTGASRLRASSTSQPITIHWTASIRSDAKYLASTCTSTLHIRPTLEEEEMRSTLVTLAALAEEDTFNFA